MIPQSLPHWEKNIRLIQRNFRKGNVMPPYQDAGTGEVFNDPAAEFGGFQAFFKHEGFIPCYKWPGG